MAKAGLWAVTDAEERKRGERTGLDTLVVHAVNKVYNADVLFLSVLSLPFPEVRQVEVDAIEY